MVNSMPKLTREFATDVANIENTLTVFECQFVESDWNPNERSLKVPVDLLNLNTLVVRICDYDRDNQIRSMIGSNLSNFLVFGYRVNNQSEIKEAFRLSVSNENLNADTDVNIYLDLSSIPVQCKFKFHEELQRIVITRHYHIASGDSNLLTQAELDSTLEGRNTPSYPNPISDSQSIVVNGIEDVLSPKVNSDLSISYQSNPFDFHNVGSHTIWMQGKDVNLEIPNGLSYRDFNDKYLLNVEGDNTSSNPYELKSIKLEDYFDAYERNVFSFADSCVAEFEDGVEIKFNPTDFSQAIVDISGSDFHEWGVQIKAEVISSWDDTSYPITINFGHTIIPVNDNEYISYDEGSGIGSISVTANHSYYTESEESLYRMGFKVYIGGRVVRIKTITLYGFNSLNVSQASTPISGIAIPFSEVDSGMFSANAFKDLVSSKLNSQDHPIARNSNPCFSTTDNVGFTQIHGNDLNKSMIRYSLEHYSGSFNMSSLTGTLKIGDKSLNVTSQQLGKMDCRVIASPTYLTNVIVDVDVNKIEFIAPIRSAPILITVPNGQSNVELVARNCKVTLYLDNGNYVNHEIENFISPIITVPAMSDDYYVPDFTGSWIKINGYSNDWYRIDSCTATLATQSRVTLTFNLSTYNSSDHGFTPGLSVEVYMDYSSTAPYTSGFPLTQPDTPIEENNKIKRMRCLNCYEFIYGSSSSNLFTRQVYSVQ